MAYSANNNNNNSSKITMDYSDKTIIIMVSTKTIIIICNSLSSIAIIPLTTITITIIMEDYSDNKEDSITCKPLC